MLHFSAKSSSVTQRSVSPSTSSAMLRVVSLKIEDSQENAFKKEQKPVSFSNNYFIPVENSSRFIC